MTISDEFIQRLLSNTFTKLPFRMGSLCTSSGTHLEDTTNTYSSNDYNYSNDSGPKFKDVTEIFDKDANDKQRIKKEENDVKILYEMYTHVYLTIHSKKSKKYNKDRISNIITNMIEFIPSQHFDEVNKNNQASDETKYDYTTCQVCYLDFDEDDGENPRIEMEEYCAHAMICKGCFKQYLKMKIKEDDITPWLKCPATNCKAPIAPQILFEYLSNKNLYKFAEGFIRKHLARNNNFVKCQTSKCNFGWMILDKNVSKQHRLICQSCLETQNVCKDPLKNDDGFNELINNGILRLCPKCSLPTMKDKGMCNIMNCGKCGIFWNWRTRETGTSSKQLKNKARNNGSLWEPGELAYQQQLEQNNLPEFKKLLERNGIKYDPNYKRGTR